MSRRQTHTIATTTPVFSLRLTRFRPVCFPCDPASLPKAFTFRTRAFNELPLPSPCSPVHPYHKRRVSHFPSPFHWKMSVTREPTLSLFFVYLALLFRRVFGPDFLLFASLFSSFKLICNLCSPLSSILAIVTGCALSLSSADTFRSFFNLPWFFYDVGVFFFFLSFPPSSCLLSFLADYPNGRPAFHYAAPLCRFHLGREKGTLCFPLPGFLRTRSFPPRPSKTSRSRLL